jgi:cysteine sulfinate desulfinase/cysteine desulfurase-like protein
MLGGDQEFGMRAGTENLPGIVDMAHARKILGFFLFHKKQK